jgi:hypothetical protein
MVQQLVVDVQHTQGIFIKCTGGNLFRLAAATVLVGSSAWNMDMRTQKRHGCIAAMQCNVRVHMRQASI